MLSLFSKKQKKEKKSRITWFEERTARWAKKRHAEGKHDSIPHTITGRRTYIIPTRFGFVFGLAIFIMLLGAMNYSNSLAFILTFMLAAILFIAMHLTNFNLSGVQTRPIESEPVFAGDPALLKISISHQKHQRPQIILGNTKIKDSARQKINIFHSTEYSHLQIPTSKRGYLELDHYLLSTQFPFNMFHAWTVVFHPLRCLVYPKPAEHAPDILGKDSSSDSQKSSQRKGLDDFSNLRDYQWQDSPQHIAWKNYASSNQLKVKTFTENEGQTVWFDFAALEGFDTEERLSILCRLILDADKEKLSYGLRIADKEIQANHGEQHRHHCLRELALYGVISAT